MVRRSARNQAASGRRHPLYGDARDARLAQSIDVIERLIRQEDWRGARDAIQSFGRTLGVSLSGAGDVSARVYTEWLNGLDREDKNIFESFVRTLIAVAEVVFPRAARSPHLRPFEMMHVERLLQRLRDDLRHVEAMRRDDTDAYPHGRFLVIPLKGVTDTADAVRTLDAASSHIEGKFPEVLYGKVYVRKDLRPSTTPGSHIAGGYQPGTDTITLSMYTTPTRNSVMTLIHEFGHRYAARFLPWDKRKEFIELHEVGEMIPFTRAERERAAAEYMELLRHHQREDYPKPETILSPRSRQYQEIFPRELWRQLVPLVHRFRDERDSSVARQLHDAIAIATTRSDVSFPAVPEHLGREPGVFASDYGRKSWEENFAESFLAFCMRLPLPPPLQRFMASLPKGRGSRSM